MQRFDGNVSQRKFLPIGSNESVKFRLGGWPVNNRGASRFAQVDMSRHEIGVEVCFENVFDFHPVFLQQLQPFFEVDYQPTIDKKDLLSQVVNSEVIAVRSKVVFDESLLKLLPNLKIHFQVEKYYMIPMEILYH
jgi:hypothetical protein